MSETPRVTTYVQRTGNLRDPSRPWSLRWQTLTMPAPAFWYFATRDEAEHEERALQLQARRTEDRR